MKRRKFIEKSGALGIATILPVSYFSLIEKQLSFENKRPKVTPKDFGAIGDGVADDTQALIDWGAWAFDASNTDPVLYFDKNANYFTSENIQFDIVKTFELEGQNATITRDYENTIESLNVSLFFRNAQLVTSGFTLAANITKGDMTVQVTDPTGIAVGQGMTFNGGILVDDEASGTTWYKGIISIVEAVNGNVITLTDAAPENFLAGEELLFKFTNDTPFPITINKLNFSSLNHLEEYRSGKVRHLMLTGFYYPTVKNIKFNTEAYAVMFNTKIYGGTFSNIQTTHGYTENGVYGVLLSFNVNTLYINTQIKSNSHAIAIGGVAGYGVLIKDSKFESGIPFTSGYTSYDSHLALEVTADNCDIYAFSFGYGDSLVKNSRIYPDYGNNSIVVYRGVTESRNLYFKFDNNEFISDGYVNLIASGTEIEPRNGIEFTNNIFDNEDLIMHPYKVNLFENNTVVLPDKTYNLPDNNSWSNTHEGNYYDFSAATEGIITPINLDGRSNFSMFIRAGLDNLEKNTTPLAAADIGGANFWFRIEKSTNDKISLRIIDENGNNVIYSMRFQQSNLVIRTYGFTFDGSKEIRFYVDGFFIGKVDYTGGAYKGNHNLTIGKRKLKIHEKGIEQVVFYNRTLNQEEAILCTSDPSNVADYEMYLGSTKTAGTWTDESVNGNDCMVDTSIVLVP